MEVADTSTFPKGSVLVFDRGYDRHTWHKQLTDNGLFWVTRARKGMLYEAVRTLPVAEGGPVTSDQIVRLSKKRARQAGAYDIRRVEYGDPETGKTYVFITNQRKWSTPTLADIYKARWEVELFFNDQAKPEDQKLPRAHDQRRGLSDLRCLMRELADRLPEVLFTNGLRSASRVPAGATQCLCA